MQKMKNLSDIERDGIVAKGLREGVTIIVQQGKRNLTARNNKVSGNLSKSMGVSVNKKAAKGYGGFRRPEGSHAHLVDRGTTARFSSSGAYRGKMSGSLFWTDAFNSKSTAAANELMDSVSKSINRLINK